MLGPILPVPLSFLASQMLTFFFSQTPLYVLELTFLCRSTWAMQKVFLVIPHALIRKLLKLRLIVLRVFWEMQRGLFCFQNLTLPKCLKKKETNALSGYFFVTSFTLEQNSTSPPLLFFLLHFHPYQVCVSFSETMENLLLLSPPPHTHTC